MPGSFHVHRSNRLERLVTALGDLLALPVGTPLDPDLVVVQGRGMGIWLGGELSKRFGVWAAPLVYPRAFVERVAQSVLGKDALGDPPLSEDLLEWAVLAALPKLERLPEFATLLRYREGDTTGTRTAELAQRIAQVFDQYLTYRPEWLKAWQSGDFADLKPADCWQGLLWQHVAHELKRPHLAGAVEQLASRLDEKTQSPGLPPRVLVFGLSTLPPLYVRVLALLSRHCDVHCFLFSPAPGAFAVSTKASNGLVESLGFLGNDFERVLNDELKRARVSPVLHDLHQAPAGSSLLAHLQADLHGRVSTPRPKVARSTQKGIAATPEISVHSCHGAMREVEVLHDQLLALLTREQDRVAPEEVIVLVPDLSNYAPLIDAVFARDLGDPQFIPYHVADQSERQQEPLIEALLRVLRLVRGRAKSSEVLDLLLLEPVARRLGIDAVELERVREWVIESGVRWGMDPDHRTSLGLPETEANTWQFGLTRLLLGYAMPGQGKRMFGGVLAYDEVEGKQAHVLGKLVGFTRKLFSRLTELQAPRSLAAWITTLNELASELFTSDHDSVRQVARLGRLLDGQRILAEAAGFHGEVDVQLLRRLLERELDQAGADRGFFSGGVTFCALVPMRSIPFKVVTLLGMNDGDFPRSPAPLEIDLIRKSERRPGDRSRRDDDRYLFLETLCAARERLIITYTGQSMRDNRKRPPSVCVSELLQQLSAPEVLIEHKLQAFNPEYFETAQSPLLFSYAESYAVAAQSTLVARQHPRLFFQGALSPTPIEEVRLEDLIRFFRSPAAYFLNRRLGLYLKHDDRAVSDREPLELDTLEGWILGHRLLTQLLLGSNYEEAEAILRAEGALPYGHSATLLLGKVAEACHAIADRVREARGDVAREPLSLRVVLDNGVRITGTVHQRWALGRVIPTYSEIKARHELQPWIEHVASCAQGAGESTTLIGRKNDKVGKSAWRPLSAAQARGILMSLVSIYVRGQERPLPFLPMTSGKYHKAMIDPRKALDQAVSAYDSDERSEAQRDPHAARTFSGLLPPFDQEFDAGRKVLDETEFHELARAVYDPMTEAEIQ